jgi:hypothetical protein
MTFNRRLGSKSGSTVLASGFLRDEGEAECGTGVVTIMS